jgi:hypothetical protein
MKDFWKYVALFLTLVILGGSLVTMHNHSKLQDKIIELQEMTPDTVQVNHHDTIYFDSIQVKWRTQHDTAKYVIYDTFYHNDTIIIVKEKIMCLDTFSVNERYQDSIIDATVNIQGRGIYENTFIDSLSFDYNINTDALVPKKKCCWIKRLFGCCD